MVVCAPWESIQTAKRRGQTAQRRLFVSFPVDPTVIRCFGVAARRGQSVECRLQTLPQLPDREGGQVLSRGKGSSTQSLPYTVSPCALHEPTVPKQFRFQLNLELRQISLPLEWIQTTGGK
jgi:hypothetical protein